MPGMLLIRSPGTCSLPDSLKPDLLWWNLILPAPVQNPGRFCVPHTYHVSAIHRGGHLDLPEVLPVCQLLVAADGGRATAVLHVEVHLAVVTRQQGGR